ncbi:MAG: hypothetical protein IJI36_00745 [Kiritimatiellae bacterium]|nr:hypothetical protein [Kiritimatiellia bacterium]
MFIKLTRTDGRPIWINPEFIVTVENRKDGGAIVVPAGDGLDYDVKESSDAVMRLCGGEPPAEAPVPEPPPPDPNEALPIVNAPDLPVDQAEATVQALREKVKRLRETAAAKKPDEKAVPSAEPPPAEAPEAEPKPAAKPRKRTSRKKPAIDLTDEQMERLKKMAPGSRQKLLNTLAHLKVPNAEATAVALLAHKVIEMTPDNHVKWLVQ